jgi:hypothetical protein
LLDAVRYTMRRYSALQCTVPPHSIPDSVQQLHDQQPSTYAKPDAASAILGF